MRSRCHSTRFRRPRRLPAHGSRAVLPSHLPGDRSRVRQAARRDLAGARRRDPRVRAAQLLRLPPRDRRLVLHGGRRRCRRRVRGARAQAGQSALEPLFPRRHRPDHRRQRQPALVRQGLRIRRPAAGRAIRARPVRPRDRPGAGRRLRGAPCEPVARPDGGDRGVRLPQVPGLPAWRPRRVLRRVLSGHEDGLRADGRARGQRSVGRRRSRGSSPRSPTPRATC